MNGSADAPDVDAEEIIIKLNSKKGEELREQQYKLVCKICYGGIMLLNLKTVPHMRSVVRFVTHFSFCSA